MVSKKKLYRNIIIVLMVALLYFSTTSFLPFSLGNNTVNLTDEEYEVFLKFKELYEVNELVQELYYKPIDEEKLLDGVLSGLLFGLDDPYSYYYTPEEFKKMEEDDKGEYAGVGLQIMSDYKTGLCTVSRVFLDSPSFDVGIKKGDILIKVEDLDVDVYTLQEAVNIMRGHVGEPVNITMLRNNEEVDFVVTREIVQVNRVNSMMLPQDVGYIALYDFTGDTTAKDFETHMDKLMENNPKSLILDLRDNSGGWVNNATDIADMFIDKGIITYLEYNDGSKEEYSAKKGVKYNIPMVILINEYSASATELLSIALKEYGLATLMGKQSYGKGVAQIVLPVGKRGGGMQMTVAEYFSPLGTQVHEIGVPVDIEVSLKEGDNTMYQLGDLDDIQLKHAFDYALTIQ